MKYKPTDLVTVKITWADHYCEDHVETFSGRFGDVQRMVQDFDTRIRQNPDFLCYDNVHIAHEVSLGGHENV